MSSFQVNMSLCCTIKEKWRSHGTATVKKTACQQLNSTTQIYLLASLMDDRIPNQMGKFKRALLTAFSNFLLSYTPQTFLQDIIFQVQHCIFFKYKRLHSSTHLYPFQLRCSDIIHKYLPNITVHFEAEIRIHVDVIICNRWTSLSKYMCVSSLQFGEVTIQTKMLQS